MIRLLEFIECLIAGVLFLVVIAGLPGLKSESAFRLAYAVLAIDMVLLGVVLNFALLHLHSFSRVLYFTISGGVVFVSWIAFVLVARMINATDSSHGGSVWIVMSGSIAFVLVGLVLISRRKRSS